MDQTICSWAKNMPVLAGRLVCSFNRLCICSVGCFKIIDHFTVNYHTTCFLLRYQKSTSIFFGFRLCQRVQRQFFSAEQLFTEDWSWLIQPIFRYLLWNVLFFRFEYLRSKTLGFFVFCHSHTLKTLNFSIGTLCKYFSRSMGILTIGFWKSLFFWICTFVAKEILVVKSLPIGSKNRAANKVTFLFAPLLWMNWSFQTIEHPWHLQLFAIREKSVTNSRSSSGICGINAW